MMDNSKDIQQENMEANEQVEEQTVQEQEVDELTHLQNQLEAKEDAYLRIVAEFDNFRKRSAKERIEFVKLANRDTMTQLLPVLDDMMRAKQSIDESSDLDSAKQGLDLIFNKLNTALSNKGLQMMDVKGEEFNAEIHEAITEVPAPNDELKGKIIDVVEHGFKLNDVIIRFPKVVVGK